MEKFEVRNDPQEDGSEGHSEDRWGIVNVDTGETLLTGNHDDLGWIGRDYFKKFTRVLNQLHEHPEDF